MGPLGLDPHPFRLRQVLEIDDADAELLAQPVDPFFPHHVRSVRRAAPFADGDALCAHVPELQDQVFKRVVVRRAGKFMRGVEVRLKQHRLALYRVDPQQINGNPDALRPLTGFDDRYGRFSGLPAALRLSGHVPPSRGFPCCGRDRPRRDRYQEFTPVHNSTR